MGGGVEANAKDDAGASKAHGRRGPRILPSASQFFTSTMPDPPIPKEGFGPTAGVATVPPPIVSCAFAASWDNVCGVRPRNNVVAPNRSGTLFRVQLFVKRAAI